MNHPEKMISSGKILSRLRIIIIIQAAVGPTWKKKNSGEEKWAIRIKDIFDNNKTTNRKTDLPRLFSIFTTADLW